MVDAASGIPSTSYSPPGTLNNDEYFWRVRAVDGSDNKAPWPVTPWRFRRAWPEQPELVYPSGAVPAGQPFFYEWNAIERASSYEVLLFDSSGTRICSATTIHTTLAGQCSPSSSGTYTWKVRATDVGGRSPVTDVLAQDPVRFTWTRPDAVTPLPAGQGFEPVTGMAVSHTGTAAYGVGVDRDACEAELPATCSALRQTPVLTWDPVPGATEYRVSLFNDRERTNPVSSYTDMRVTEAMWSPLQYQELRDSQAGSAYFWDVQPCDSRGCAPVTSYPTHSFAKQSIAPQLQSPAQDEVVADDVTLRWSSQIAALRAPGVNDGSDVTTPGTMEAQQYVVQTSTSPSFQSLIDNVTVDERTFTSPTNTYPEGPVFWRVSAIDGSGTGTVWSEPRRFEKRSPVPALVSPVPNGDLGQDQTLTWSPLSYAASYELEVERDGMSSLLERTKHSSWAPSNVLPVSDLPYRWRVRRVDARGRQGSWSDYRTFYVRSYPPALLAPAADGRLTPAGELFSWMPDDRATSYRFERTGPGGGLAEVVTTRATAYAPTSTLPGGAGTWRVTALDAASQPLGVSERRSFTVVDTPVAVTQVSIAGSGKVGTQLTSSDPTFEPRAEQVTYQWFRGATSIYGATGPTYEVLSEDVGQKITLQATGTRSGYKAGTSTSNVITGARGDALVAIHPPTIRGSAAVGQGLTVAPGTWPGNPQLSYQWLRKGDPIAGATGSTYYVAADDAARTISVVETANVNGREPGTSRSGGVDVARIGSTTTVGLSATKISKRTRVVATASVSVSGVAAPGGAVSFFDGGRKLKAVPLRTGLTATFRLPRLQPGKHVVKVVYGGTDQVSGSKGAARLVVTRR